MPRAPALRGARLQGGQGVTARIIPLDASTYHTRPHHIMLGSSQQHRSLGSADRRRHCHRPPAHLRAAQRLLAGHRAIPWVAPGLLRAAGAALGLQAARAELEAGEGLRLRPRAQTTMRPVKRKRSLPMG